MATKREREQRAARTVNVKAWAEQQDKGFESSSVSLPDGVEFFQLKKEGKYYIDILPYVAGKGNPSCDEGCTHMERTFYVHKDIGPENKSFLCPAKYGKRCPICEELRKGNMDQETRDAIKVKTRMLWPVFDHSDKTIKIWDTAYYKSFGEMLKDKVQADDDTYGNFTNLTKEKGGMTLILKVDNATYNGRSFRQVKNIEMVGKKIDHEDSIIDDVPCLDDLLIVLPYDELKRIFLQEGDSEEEDDKPIRGKAHPKDDDDSDDDDEPKKSPMKNTASGKKTTKSSSTDDDDEDDTDDEDNDNKTAKECGIKVGMSVKHKKFGVCEVLKISPDETSLLLKDEDDETHRGVGPDEVQIIKGKAKPADDDEDTDEDEEEEEVKKPARGKKPAGKKKVEEEDEDDDSDDDSDADDDDGWDEDDEEEEVKKPARGKKK